MSEMPEPEPTLLVVDDEVEILDALKRTLRGQGYKILTTTSPRQALELLDAGGVDVLLSDIDMPEMDGIELISRTRAKHPGVVRLLLTGDASLRSALTAINQGEVHRYLLKPWQRDELRTTIREALDRLAELRRAAAADGRATVKKRMLSELEREHPGVSEVRKDDGVYALEIPRIQRIATGIAWTELRTFFDITEPSEAAPTPPGPPAEPPPTWRPPSGPQGGPHGEDT